MNLILLLAINVCDIGSVIRNSFVGDLFSVSIAFSLVSSTSRMNYKPENFHKISSSKQFYSQCVLQTRKLSIYICSIYRNAYRIDAPVDMSGNFVKRYVIITNILT